jgi:hypothetical protein
METICRIIAILLILNVSVIFSIKPSEIDNEGGNRILEKEVVVRAKADQLTEKDRELYTSVSADNSFSSSKYGGEHVSAKLSLQRRIWTSGSTIFCALHVSNDTNTLVILYSHLD